METRVTKSPRVAAAIIRDGGLVAFPTETVYGLGADAFNAKAVKSIFRAKGRPQDNPLIVHMARMEDLAVVAHRIPRSAEKLIDAFFPGSLTVIVPKHGRIPDAVTAGLDTVGIRFPAHSITHDFLLNCGTPVAAPSANRSGRPSPTTWKAALDELNGRVDGILKGGSSRVGLESTVVDCTVSRPVILREGAVTLEQLREVVPTIRTGTSGRVIKSPGVKYRHYAPSAKVVLVDGPADVGVTGIESAAYIGMHTSGFRRRPAFIQKCRGVDPYAQKLFQFFRVCEERGLKLIYCEKVSSSGLGRALMDRLRKAAADHPTGP